MGKKQGELQISFEKKRTEILFMNKMNIKKVNS